MDRRKTSNNLVIGLIGFAVIVFSSIGLVGAFSGGAPSTVVEVCNNCFGGSEIGFGAAPSGDFTALTDLYIEDDLNVDGTVTLVGALDWKQSATTTDGVDATIADTSSHELILIKGTGATTTLPAVSITGATVRVSVLEAFATNDWVVQSAEGDNINGSLFVNDAIVACSAEDRIKFVADGEEIGDFIELYSNGTNWNIINSRGEAASKLICTDPS